MSITARQIAMLQAIRRKNGVSDEDWTEMKTSVGARSTRELDRRQMDELLERLGVTPNKDHHTARRSGMRKPWPQDRKRLLSKVEAILADLSLPWSYADGMAKRMHGVECLRMCDAEQTYKVLQALIVHQRRKVDARADGDVRKPVESDGGSKKSVPNRGQEGR